LIGQPDSPYIQHVRCNWSFTNSIGDGSTCESAIRNGSGGWFTARQSAELHARAATWLAGKLDEPFPGTTVVITHHAPHPNSAHKRYNGHLLNGAFVSDLTRLMGKAALWIHGHTHDSFDYAVAGTRVIANPKGYVNENKAFDPSLVVTVPT